MWYVVLKGQRREDQDRDVIQSHTLMAKSSRVGGSDLERELSELLANSFAKGRWWPLPNASGMHWEMQRIALWADRCFASQLENTLRSLSVCTVRGERSVEWAFIKQKRYFIWLMVLGKLGVGMENLYCNKHRASTNCTQSRQGKAAFRACAWSPIQRLPTVSSSWFNIEK